jgi:hypothetical protein
VAVTLGTDETKEAAGLKVAQHSRLADPSRMASQPAKDLPTFSYTI